jgi:hypothetical protein
VHHLLLVHTIKRRHSSDQMLASLRRPRKDGVRRTITLLTQSLVEFRRAGAKHGVEACFELLARIAQRRGSLERAAWCWGVVAQLEGDMGKQLRPKQHGQRVACVGELQTLMRATGFAAAHTAGRRVTLEEAFLAVLPDGGLAIRSC